MSQSTFQLLDSAANVPIVMGESKGSQRSGSDELDDLPEDVRKRFELAQSHRDELAEKLREKEQETERLVKDQLKSRVVSAAARAGARDADELFVLMEHEGVFRREDGAWVVVDPESGRPQIDLEARGEPVSVDRAVERWLKDRPHHKRESGRTGSGQGNDRGSGREVPLPDGKDPASMTPSELYANRHAVLDAVRAGYRSGR